ncbi:hypothetical protein R8871_01716 [Paraburkholderia graminis C4D1M]|jgi:hypothetical protein|uniref:DUF2894 domain-containing protein n=1 Tax=Paraburkholderia graminis (strain ATCC 700544 / DSM 17151 / LMG 18924 / NCIMB 13744 / C4D1M) TaxID=396598 RepID=B1G0K9_PARG4|nr:DUF2894 domain-containing protein [Paraburkholderia graminis]EDT10090.1 conserved hypothetical protein [Paraburkholderia graminis C4D1M]CAB3665109.1 hypothetical protein R8871_01716 [Paraburkholderia graminis C4D1M]
MTEAAGDTQTPRAMLDAWRERGADRVDPSRFRFIDALERRAAAQCGETRRVLDERLAVLLDAYARQIAAAERDACDAMKTDNAARTAESTTGAGPLVQLIAELQSASQHRERNHTAYPELPELDYFRQTWAKVRTDKQLRQSLQPAPGNAGPLNSSSLVHRSLSLMRELSPGYLKQFLSYVDALSWIEQLNGGAPPSKEPPRAATGGKGGRGKTR